MKYALGGTTITHLSKCFFFSFRWHVILRRDKVLSPNRQRMTFNFLIACHGINCTWCRPPDANSSVMLLSPTDMTPLCDIAPSHLSPYKNINTVKTGAIVGGSVRSRGDIQ